LGETCETDGMAAFWEDFGDAVLSIELVKAYRASDGLVVVIVDVVHHGDKFRK